MLNRYIPLLVLVSTYSATIAAPGLTHTIEVDGDVAATFHLEPNHNPKAGSPALVWFALTRAGGQVVPLSQCNCQLSIYKEPRRAEAKPILQPALKPINAEQYQEIPGATVSFPQAGRYQLELKGQPQAGAGFNPFTLTYEATVTGGVAPPPSAAATSTTAAATKPVAANMSWPWVLGVGAIVLGLVTLPFLRRKAK